MLGWIRTDANARWRQVAQGSSQSSRYPVNQLKERVLKTLDIQ